MKRLDCEIEAREWSQGLVAGCRLGDNKRSQRSPGGASAPPSAASAASEHASRERRAGHESTVTNPQSHHAPRLCRQPHSPRPVLALARNRPDVAPGCQPALARPSPTAKRGKFLLSLRLSPFSATVATAVATTVSDHRHCLCRHPYARHPYARRPRPRRPLASALAPATASPIPRPPHSSPSPQPSFTLSASAGGQTRRSPLVVRRGWIALPASSRLQRMVRVGGQSDLA
eukprot:7379932-Prymnesium_polylepis.1